MKKTEDIMNGDNITSFTIKIVKNISNLITARMDEHKIPDDPLYRNFVCENVVISLLSTCIITKMRNNPILDRTHIMQKYVEWSFELIDLLDGRKNKQ